MNCTVFVNNYITVNSLYAIKYISKIIVTQLILIMPISLLVIVGFTIIYLSLAADIENSDQCLYNDTDFIILSDSLNRGLSFLNDHKEFGLIDAAVGPRGVQGITFLNYYHYDYE